MCSPMVWTNVLLTTNGLEQAAVIMAIIPTTMRNFRTIHSCRPILSHPVATTAQRIS